MANNAGDTWGCIFAVAAIGVGAWLLWDKYEVRERETGTTSFTPSPSRPTGDLYVATMTGGTVWNLDADSLRGPREARMAWIKADHTNDGTVSHRETNTLYELDCDRGSYITRKVVNYDAEGKSLASWGEETFSETPDFAPPDSNIAQVLLRACDPAFD